MTKLAEHIVIERHGRHFSLKIDGEEFPWYIAEDGIATEVVQGDIGSVTVRIIADRVTVDNDCNRT